MDKHLGMFHQKNTKQSFEKAQKYVEESTHYEFKEYHLSTILSFYSGVYLSYLNLLIYINIVLWSRKNKKERR